MSITLEKLQALVKDNPELLEDPSLETAINKLEGKAAQKHLVVVADKVKQVIEECYADGVLPSDQVTRIDMLDVRYIDPAENNGSFVKVSINPNRRARGTSKRSSNGSTHNITKAAWVEKGFEAFVVAGRHLNQPIKAIEAAGGERKKKDDGTLASENYWRAILENGFVKLPILAKIGGTEKTLPEVREMFGLAA